RITKEIGPESGLLTFSGVSRIHMPDRLTIEGIACGGLEVLPAGYLGPPDDSLDPSDRVFVLRESWGRYTTSWPSRRHTKPMPNKAMQRTRLRRAADLGR